MTKPSIQNIIIYAFGFLTLICVGGYFVNESHKARTIPKKIHWVRVCDIDTNAFTDRYREVIDSAVARGWPACNILINGDTVYIRDTIPYFGTGVNDVNINTNNGAINIK